MNQVRSQKRRGGCLLRRGAVEEYQKTPGNTLVKAKYARFGGVIGGECGHFERTNWKSNTRVISDQHRMIKTEATT